MALADPVRRAIVARLSRSEATVNELAEPFAITKQAVSRHIQVLEHAGLVTRSQDAQRRPVHLNTAALESLTAWIDRYRLSAEARFSAPRRLTRDHTDHRAEEGKGGHMTHPTTITAEPGLPFVDIIREFDAPAAAVFRAHTDPVLFAQWTGPRTMTVDNVELDATTGGRWKYEFPGEGNAMYSFFGVFHTVEPNKLIIQTFEFNLAPGQAGISSTSFEEVDPRTRLSVREVYPSVEARDAAMASGMEYGIKEGYERLDELLTPVGGRRSPNSTATTDSA
jgi:uncharacterized protein YndB with AHSA1/START domain/DNA-binding transcriptional ArsR family regulator